VSRLFTSIGVRIALVGVIVVVAFLLRDRVSGAASDLKVGDCFDLPSAEIQEINDVLHHPCTEVHTGEVFHVFSHDVGSEGTYPSYEEWGEIAEPVCATQFTIYTGRDLDASSDLDFGLYYPTPDGWRLGDRAITCILYRVDEQPMTRSYRAASS